jgi:hypothetical protein
MKLIAALVLSAAAVFSTAITADQRRILLEDGTELVGEILSMRNGSYTIRTKTLGTLTVSDRQIRQMTSRSNPSSNAVTSGSSLGNPSQLGVQALQERMSSDSPMLQQIMALQNSPEMKAVLSDPEVMSAIERLDFDTLANHPKIIRLMNNQGVKSITSRVN